MITPNEVKQYSDFDAVKNRTDAQLKFDIVQAKQDIYRYCGHKFEEYKEIPEEVKLAFIKLTEYYALINSDEGIAKGIQSESLGNYSYTLGDKKHTLSLKSLLDEYVGSNSKRGIKFKLRSV